MLTTLSLLSTTAGDPTAELSLAHCYSHGKGVTQDLTKAFQYHLSAAEKGICVQVTLAKSRDYKVEWRQVRSKKRKVLA